jgi:hypothetical protein
MAKNDSAGTAPKLKVAKSRFLILEALSTGAWQREVDQIRRFLQTSASGVLDYWGLKKSCYWDLQHYRILPLYCTVYSHLSFSHGLQERPFLFRPRRAENHDVSKIHNQIVSLACVRAASQSQTNTSSRFLKSDGSLDAQKLQLFPPGSQLSCSLKIKYLSEYFNWHLIHLPMFGPNSCCGRSPQPLGENSESFPRSRNGYIERMGKLGSRRWCRATFSSGWWNYSTIETWWYGWCIGISGLPDLNHALGYLLPENLHIFSAEMSWIRKPSLLYSPLGR